jgi:peptide chain release factor subunit 1
VSVNWDTLRELAGFRAERGCAISFYLNLDPHLSPTAADVQTQMRALLDEAEKRAEASRAELTHDQRASIRSGIEQVETYYGREFSRDGTRGLSVFVAAIDGVWRPLPLSSSVQDAVRVGREFYVTPLVPLVADGDGAIVAVVGRERGDLYELHDGRLEPLAERFEEQPRRHDQGGRSQANYQRHVDSLVDRHLRGVAEELERRLRRRRAAQVVIACSEDIRSEFAGLLSAEAVAAVAGWVTADAHSGGKELLSAVEPVLERKRVEHEAEAVTRWHDHMGQGSRACAGWGPTLEAASDGRIDLLLYEAGANHEAWCCPRCDRLQLEGGACPLDGTDLERRDDGLDLVLHRTLARGGTALMVTARRDLDPVGGIGALLRF